MADLIDRQAVCDTCMIKKGSSRCYSCIIYDAPAVDAVEVVRCKDCVNAREMDKYEKKLYLDECVGCTRLSSSYHSIIMAPDDFCSYGERREEDEIDKC